MGATDWYNLGMLAVAIANRKATPSSAEKLDDNPVNCVSALIKQIDASISARNELRKSASALLEMYIRLANWFHAGNWDPETAPQVIALRAALNKE